MAQLSLYMDEAAMKALREDAEKANLSISAYAREVLEDRHEGNRKGWENGWPVNYWDLYGSCPDFPEVEDYAPEQIDPLPA